MCVDSEFDALVRVRAWAGVGWGTVKFLCVE